MKDETFSKALYERFSEKGKKEAVDYKTNVVAWVNKCREDGGNPIFKTRYAEKRFPNNSVLGVCWFGKGETEGKWFSNVPEEDVLRMELEKEDWKWIKEKYGGQDDR